MTLFFNSHQIIIHRLHSKGNFKEAYSATGTVYPADIQPVPQRREDLVQGRIQKLYQAWVDPECIVKEGDIVVASSKKYSVQAVSVYEGAGLLSHKELIISSMD